jgi:hypothetical protein
MLEPCDSVIVARLLMTSAARGCRHRLGWVSGMLGWVAALGNGLTEWCRLSLWLHMTTALAADRFDSSPICHCVAADRAGFGIPKC